MVSLSESLKAETNISRHKSLSPFDSYKRCHTTPV